MRETTHTITQWHSETFPDATLDGQIKKYQEEQREWIESGYKDLMELADMFIVACGIARFDMQESAWAISDVYNWLTNCVNPASQRDFFRCVDIKMDANRKRIWKKTAEGTFHHV